MKGIERMKVRGPSRALLAVVLLPALALAATYAWAHGADAPAERLAKIGSTQDFTLTAQDGTGFSTAQLRGKVVALNFVFTRCADVCPIATAKMVQIQRALGEQFGRDVFFVSVSVDPAHDTPEVLAGYAGALGFDPSGWVFLTGSPAAIKRVARSYGVFHDRRSGGEVDHNLLTSLIDREGTLRVQYMGERFDPGELLHDLRDLIAEESSL
jgi:protein SCO1/2